MAVDLTKIKPTKQNLQALFSIYGAKLDDLAKVYHTDAATIGATIGNKVLPLNLHLEAAQLLTGFVIERVTRFENGSDFKVDLAACVDAVCVYYTNVKGATPLYETAVEQFDGGL